MRGAMAGITQKSRVALFPLWFLKKTFLGGRTNVNLRNTYHQLTKLKMKD